MSVAHFLYRNEKNPHGGGREGGREAWRERHFPDLLLSTYIRYHPTGGSFLGQKGDALSGTLISHHGCPV